MTFLVLVFSLVCMFVGAILFALIRVVIEERREAKPEKWCQNCGEWLPDGRVDVLCVGCRHDAEDTDMHPGDMHYQA